MKHPLKLTILLLLACGDDLPASTEGSTGGVGVGGACQNEATCGPGLLCADGLCLPGCSSDAECVGLFPGFNAFCDFDPTRPQLPKHCRIHCHAADNACPTIDRVVTVCDLSDHVCEAP